jgi:hypothetical protein
LLLKKNRQVEPNVEGGLTVGMIARLAILSSGFSAKSFSGFLRGATLLQGLRLNLFLEVMTQIIPADSKTFHHITVTDKGLRKGYGCTRNRNHEQTISLFGSHTLAGIEFFTGDIAGSQPSRGWWPKNKRRVYGEERNGQERVSKIFNGRSGSLFSPSLCRAEK